MKFIIIFCLALAITSANAGEHEILIETPNPEVTLAGTLSVPQNETEGPMIIFITGSGDHERDSVISGTPIYKVLSDFFVDRGYATLRVDDRGTGDSTGPGTLESVNADRVADTIATVNFAAMYADFNATEIGLIGLSEGAMLAAQVGAKLPDEVNWLIMLSAPSRPGSEVWFDQQIASFITELGANHPNIEKARTAIRNIIHLSIENASYDTMEAAAVELFATANIDEETARSEGMIEQFVKRMTDNWMRDFLAHDPGTSQKLVTQPVLAVYGAIDHLTSPELNAGPLISNLANAPTNDIQLVILPEQDHFFLRGEGLPAGQHKYGQMHVAPKLMQVIETWLERNTE